MVNYLPDDNDILFLDVCNEYSGLIKLQLAPFIMKNGENIQY